MITTNTVEGRIEMRAFGRLTLADLKAFEAQSDALDTKRDLLLDLRNLGGTSLDALIEEWKYAHQHAQDFRRIAVISEDSFVSWGACLSQLFVDAEIRLFESEAQANRWLASPEFEPDEEPPADATPQ